MYGMINEGIRSFIVENHGQEAWRDICATAGLKCTEFERMTNYSDTLTYDLVGAISQHTGLPANDVLKVFGEYWLEFAGTTRFGSLMRLAGRTFVERLRWLDDMHDRIVTSMPGLNPPSFELEVIEDRRFHLHYFSDREGLAPMVIGLLYGLAAETGDVIEIRHMIHRGDQSDHDVFEITMQS
ncbi:heme NO-binding domain-containing protein [Amaricoccus macauensis]|uniref:heme NO-binding domain-containing protein n=1 Tax=Amaricoccus macauensis TaxID=57001 RepID=UPI003C7A371F